MDQDLMAQILSMGSDEEAIAELLRSAAAQDEIAAGTRGNDYLMDAGRMKVANPWGAVSDMFVRGNAEKKAKDLRDQVPNMRARGDEKTKDYLNSLLGRGLGGVDLNAQAEVKPGAPLNIQAPQVPPPPAPPPPNPAGPPAPPGPPQPPPAPPAPAPGPRPPGAPGVPGGGAPGMAASMAGNMFGAPGGAPFSIGKDLLGGLGKTEDEVRADEIIALLTGRK